MPDIQSCASAAQQMVGMEFAKNGRRFVVRRVVIEFDDADTGTKHLSRYADGIEEFSDWINSAKEVTDG